MDLWYDDDYDTANSLVLYDFFIKFFRLFVVPYITLDGFGL